jgi:WNK lysine deficient protein kinase
MNSTDENENSLNNQQKAIETDPNKRYIKTSKDCIGQGSFKKVYKGYALNRGIEVAWNEIINFGELKKEQQKRILDEISMQKHFHHENILKIYHFWQEENRFIYITELMTTGTLREFFILF